VQWIGSNPASRPRRMTMALKATAARGIWSRFASPRAELIGAPSLSRPSLFSGD